MFLKETFCKLDLNSIEILDGELIKTAAFKLPDGIHYDPDFFYCKVKAVSAGEYWGCNKNFDYFSEEELKKNYKTFLNAHVFKNHENKDIANAIGDVIDATWDDKMKCVILLIRIDRRIAPTVVRGFEKGFMTDVSMGCRIAYSVCSICGNKAKTKHDYCDHIKYMRGKIFNDGKKVYEINIQPKFHDISAVLNGAEKSAKIQNMILSEKTASNNETMMEKAASFENAFSCEDTNDENMPKNTYEENLVLFEKKASKKEYIQKVAEIKKEIQGKIINIAKGELLADNSDKVDAVSKIFKLLYTDYMDKDKCEEIGSQLNELSLQRQTPPEVVFDQFLKVLDFAGIDLSPLEFHEIYTKLIGHSTPNLRSLKNKNNILGDVHKYVDNVDSLEDEHSFAHAIDMPSMFNTVQHSVLPNLKSVRGLTENPANRLKAVVIKLKMPVPRINEDLMYDDIMHNIVNPIMPSRSSHRRFIIKRFNDVANGKREPNMDNAVHFMPAHLLGENNTTPDMLPFLLSALMHANYERERVAHFNSDDMEYGLTKFASYIDEQTMDNMFNEYINEKTAGKKGYTTGKALFIGVPATFAYSALQRARINNGDNVNGLNRYVAENPGNAGLVQLIFGPKIYKHLKGGAGKINAHLVSKYASEENFLENIYKEANVYDNSLYTEDMFKDKEIDNALKQVYNDNQVDILKEACLLNFMERQDLATEILSKVALDENDIDKYLKIAKDSIKIEIEKNASEISQLAKSTAVNGMLHPVGNSTAAILPGLMLDTAAFLWLDKKLNKKINK